MGITHHCVVEVFEPANSYHDDRWSDVCQFEFGKHSVLFTLYSNPNMHRGWPIDMSGEAEDMIKNRGVDQGLLWVEGDKLPPYDTSDSYAAMRAAVKVYIEMFNRKMRVLFYEM